MQLYSTPEVDRIGLWSCDISPQATMVLIGQSIGRVVQLDLRVGSEPVNFVEAHKKTIRSVHINPVRDHLMLTASADS